MRKLFVPLFSFALLCAVGCEPAKQGEPVATSEDDFAAYDAMMAEAEAETAAEEAADGE